MAKAKIEHAHPYEMLAEYKEKLLSRELPLCSPAEMREWENIRWQYFQYFGPTAAIEGLKQSRAIQSIEEQPPAEESMQYAIRQIASSDADEVIRKWDWNFMEDWTYRQLFDEITLFPGFRLAACFGPTFLNVYGQYLAYFLWDNITRIEVMRFATELVATSRNFKLLDRKVDLAVLLSADLDLEGLDNTS